MKILQVISSLGNGGAEKFVVELSNELSNAHEISICSFKKIESGMIFPRLINEKIKLISLNKKNGFDLRMYFSLYKILKNENPNIVHFHLDASIKYIFPLIFLFPKINFIHTIHSDLNSEKKRIFSGLNRFSFFLKRIKLICISESIYQDFKRNFHSLNFLMIENGIKRLSRGHNFELTKKEVLSLKKNNNTKVFISIGRIDENKNQALQVEAFEQLKSSNCILLIIGKDPSINEKTLTPLLNKNLKNVHFLGVKSEINNYLELSDAFIMTSINEGLPIVALEALSIGIPIITSRAGGMKDLVINNENGLVCQNNSISELIDQIHFFLSLTKEQIERIGENNRNKFDNYYTIKKCADEYLKIYTK